MGVDVLVSGHTHKLSVRQGAEGGLYINPGSATGCSSIGCPTKPKPSFVLIDVQGNKVVTYSYILDEERGSSGVSSSAEVSLVRVYLQPCSTVRGKAQFPSPYMV